MRRTLAAATATVAALALAGGCRYSTRSALQAGDQPRPVGEAAAPSTTAATVVPVVAPAEPSEPALTADSKVTVRGIGDVEVGMSAEEAASAAGLPLVPVPGTVDRQCYFVQPDGGPPGVRLMISAGTVARVDVTGGPVTTVSGAGVGSTEDQIHDLFPDQIEESPHQVVAGGHYLTFVPDAGGDLQVVFETDGVRVTAYRAGRTPEVGWHEGCP